MKKAQQRLYFLHQLRKFNLPQELLKQFLLCHHWIHPLHVNNCLVQLSYQIWPQKTTEGSPDCWANHWYNPSPLSKNCTYPEWAKGLAKSLWTPHIQHTPSWTDTVWLTLQSSEHQNNKTQDQFLPSSPKCDYELIMSQLCFSYYLWLPCVFSSCILSSFSSGLLVTPRCSCVPCLALLTLL